MDGGVCSAEFDAGTVVTLTATPDCGLLLHGYDESKSAPWANKTTGLSSDVWGEGLGWYAILIADVFDWLPADHPSRPTLMGILQKIVAGLKANQDAKTGRWCQVVDKCSEPGNWNESSGTGMVTVHWVANGGRSDGGGTPRRAAWHASVRYEST